MQTQLKALLEGTLPPETAREWAADVSRRYPFFSLPSAMTLRAAGEKPSEATLLRLALTTRGADALAHLTGDADTRFDNFYPPAKQVETPTTTKAIDDFLERYGNQSEQENQLLERMIFNPVPDYAQQLAREADENLPGDAEPADDSHQARITRFILAEHRRRAPSAMTEPAAAPATGAAPVKVDKPAPTPEQSLLSESLAKIYIKMRKYERAYEILSRLSLEFPEKNRYFADQLRFLKKLILNEKYRNLSNNGQNAQTNE